MGRQMRQKLHSGVLENHRYCFYGITSKALSTTSMKNTDKSRVISCQVDQGLDMTQLRSG